MPAMPRRLFLALTAALPTACLGDGARSTTRGATAPAAAAKPGGFVDYDGWIVTVDDRDTMAAARAAPRGTGRAGG